jgi:hypothetical protein
MPEPADLSFYQKVRFNKREAASSVGLAHEQWPPPYPHFSHGLMVHHLCVKGDQGGIRRTLTVPVV